jgi:predicted metalloprotease with PDZ domain
MFREFGTVGQPYDLEDIARVASEVSGEDQADFFARYVQGTELLNVAPLAAAAGLQLDTMVDEFYLSRRPDAASVARQVYSSLFEGSETVKR